MAPSSRPSSPPTTPTIIPIAQYRTSWDTRQSVPFDTISLRPLYKLKASYALNPQAIGTCNMFGNKCRNPVPSTKLDMQYNTFHQINKRANELYKHDSLNMILQYFSSIWLISLYPTYITYYVVPVKFHFFNIYSLLTWTTDPTIYFNRAHLPFLLIWLQTNCITKILLLWIQPVTPLWCLL